MTPEQFDHYADLGYNRIPLYREVLADLDTPLSVYLKLAARPYSFLFESVQGGEKWGRYSIIGLPARRHVCGQQWHRTEWSHRIERLCRSSAAAAPRYAVRCARFALRARMRLCLPGRQ